jgi:hypothetical protein
VFDVYCKSGDNHLTSNELNDAFVILVQHIIYPTRNCIQELAGG